MAGLAPQSTTSFQKVRRGCMTDDQALLALPCANARRLSQAMTKPDHTSRPSRPRRGKERRSAVLAIANDPVGLVLLQHVQLRRHRPPVPGRLAKRMCDHHTFGLISHLFTEFGLRKHLIGAQHSINMTRGAGRCQSNVLTANLILFRCGQGSKFVCPMKLSGFGLRLRMPVSFVSQTVR